MLKFLFHHFCSKKLQNEKIETEVKLKDLQTQQTNSHEKIRNEEKKYTDEIQNLQKTLQENLEKQARNERWNTRLIQEHKATLDELIEVSLFCTKKKLEMQEIESHIQLLHKKMETLAKYEESLKKTQEELEDSLQKKEREEWQQLLRNLNIPETKSSSVPIPQGIRNVFHILKSALKTNWNRQKELRILRQQLFQKKQETLHHFQDGIQTQREIRAECETSWDNLFISISLEKTNTSLERETFRELRNQVRNLIKRSKELHANRPSPQEYTACQEHYKEMEEIDRTLAPQKKTYNLLNPIYQNLEIFHPSTVLYTLHSQIEKSHAA
jgi:hypothetical protein